MLDNFNDAVKRKLEREEFIEDNWDMTVTEEVKNIEAQVAILEAEKCIVQCPEGDPRVF